MTLKKTLIAISVLALSNCNPIKKINNATSPIIPVKGCDGGFSLRARDSRILTDDALVLGVLNDLSDAAKADATATDSMLKSGIKVNLNANIASSFRKYFEFDQSISSNIWNQSSAFTQLYCMLDKISSDKKIPQVIRDDANNKKIKLIISQTEYIRNIDEQKAQKPVVILDSENDSMVYFTVVNRHKESLRVGRFFFLHPTDFFYRGGGWNGVSQVEPRTDLGDVVINLNTSQTFAGNINYTFIIEPTSSQSFKVKYSLLKYDSLMILGNKEKMDQYNAWQKVKNQMIFGMIYYWPYSDGIEEQYIPLYIIDPYEFETKIKDIHKAAEEEMKKIQYNRMRRN
jgi:uncharacterized protein (UPF0147 family)